MEKLENEVVRFKRFLRLTKDITSQLVIAQADSLDQAVDESLAKVGKYFNADQVGLGQWSKLGKVLPSLRTWGAKPVNDYLNTDGPGEKASEYLRRNGLLIWNCIEDLKEFPQFQEHVKGVGALAGVFWLYRDFGSHTHHLVMAKVKPEVWPENTIECMEVIGGVFFNALYRRQAEIEVGQLYRLQRVISNIAASLVHVHPDAAKLDINKALQQIGETTNADFCSFWYADKETEELTLDYKWSVDISVIPQTYSVNFAANYPWLTRCMKKEKLLHITNPENLPEKAKAELEKIGVQSLVLAPFKVAHGGRGYLGLGTVSVGFQHWSKDIVPQLSLVGSILANALVRRSMDSVLEQAHQQIQDLTCKISTENKLLLQEFDESNFDKSLVGKSHVFRTVLYQVDQVASTDSTVLLLGETGVGKGLVARRIHQQSGRSSKPLIILNCAALPPMLVESELFGHEKGAFTGAINRKIGRFELADCSTIFLDEVGDLPLDLQVKMLRVIQDHEFERVGSSITQTVDVRIISATNRNLDNLIEQGDFRADLYYRLGVFPIRVPSLRERRSDIPLLVWFFISELQSRLGKSFDAVSTQAMNRLTSYHWPGNIRELRNIVERAMILSQGTTLVLGDWFPGSPSLTNELEGKTIEEVEKFHITKILEECNWRIRGPDGAAEHLGLKRTTLQSRMKKLGIERPRAGLRVSPRPQ